MKSLLKRFFTRKRNKDDELRKYPLTFKECFPPPQMKLSGKLGPPDPNRPGSVARAHDLEWVYPEGKRKVLLKKFGNDPGREAAMRKFGRKIWADPDHEPQRSSVFPVIVYIVGVLVII
jgi:hypothetical protein